jgi:hypothetical protein
MSTKVQIRGTITANVTPDHDATAIHLAIL